MTDFPLFMQVIIAMAPAVAVYVAIRVDLAVLKIRMDHVEKDIEANAKTPSYPQRR